MCAYQDIEEDVLRGIGLLPKLASADKVRADKESVIDDIFTIASFTEKPGMTDLKGKAKWEAWNGRKGMSQDEAKDAYIAKSKEF